MSAAKRCAIPAICIGLFFCSSFSSWTVTGNARQFMKTTMMTRSTVVNALVTSEAITARVSWAEQREFDEQLARTNNWSLMVLGQWGLCVHVKSHPKLPPSPVILWIELGGKPKWLPLNSGYHDVMSIAPIDRLTLDHTGACFVVMFDKVSNSCQVVETLNNQSLTLRTNSPSKNESLALSDFYSWSKHASNFCSNSVDNLSYLWVFVWAIWMNLNFSEHHQLQRASESGMPLLWNMS